MESKRKQTTCEKHRLISFATYWGHTLKQTENNFQIGVVIPTYRHVSRLPEILQAISDIGLPCIVVDDGNSAELQANISSICDKFETVDYVRRDQNGGKGMAVKDGFTAAAAKNWSHVVQVDADGQHDLDALANIIALAEKHPQKVICAVPVYDASIPKSRKIGREITHFWVRLETFGNEISDSMCGFRAYPLTDAMHIIENEFIGARMDFDTEILVQLNWRGLRTVEHPVKVTYPEENISNFRMLQDNVRISLMHTRLFLQAPIRVPIRMARRLSNPLYQNASQEA